MTWKLYAWKHRSSFSSELRESLSGIFVVQDKVSKWMLTSCLQQVLWSVHLLALLILYQQNHRVILVLVWCQPVVVTACNILHWEFLTPQAPFQIQKASGLHQKTFCLSVMFLFILWPPHKKYIAFLDVSIRVMSLTR